MWNDKCMDWQAALKCHPKSHCEGRLAFVFLNIIIENVRYIYIYIYLKKTSSNGSSMRDPVKVTHSRPLLLWLYCYGNESRWLHGSWGDLDTLHTSQTHEKHIHSSSELTLDSEDIPQIFFLNTLSIFFFIDKLR